MKGRMRKMVSVRYTFIVHRMTNEATSLMEAMKNSSGQWWANSVTSNRSEVIRAMIWPTLASS